MNNNDFRYEDLNGEIVVLDTSAGVVHRITGESAEAVRAETDPVSRRTLVRAAVALGVAAGVTSLHLPAAAAAASGTGGGGGPSSTIETVPEIEGLTFIRIFDGGILHEATWTLVPDDIEYEYYVQTYPSAPWLQLYSAIYSGDQPVLAFAVGDALWGGRFRIRRVSESGATSEWVEASFPYVED